MATADAPRPAEGRPRDLIRAIRRSGILPAARLAELASKVASGAWPGGGVPLARCLVRERVLTKYQARRLLAGKSRGLTVGRYVLLAPVARGMMGRVFRAQHRLLGRVVALKLIAANVPSPRAVAWFRREMRLIGRLDHPNIVRAFDADESDGRLYIAMEYLAGSTLKSLLVNRGPLPPAEVAWYGAQAARGLAHAHARGIVHRDVKPANLMLTRGGQVKVLDLGIGALLAKEGYGPLDGDSGSFVGTIDYVSPEQACRRPLDGRSDLYSLGCSMYHLITGRLPFPGETSLERLALRIAGEHDPTAVGLPERPTGLVRVMARLLAYRPEDRYQSADEAADALFALLRDEPGFLERFDHTRAASVSASPPPSTPVTRRPRRAAKATGAILADAASCLLVALASSRPAPPATATTGPSSAVGVPPTIARASARPGPSADIPRTAGRTPTDLRDWARRVAASWAPRLPVGPGWDIPTLSARATAALESQKARRIPFEGRSPATFARADGAGPGPPVGPGVQSPLDPNFALASLTPPAPPRPPDAAPARPVVGGRVDGAAKAAGRSATARRPEAKGPPPPPPADPAPGMGPAATAAADDPPLPRTATIHVLMPSANSELVVRGEVGRGNPDEWYGSERVIHTPPLGSKSDYLVGAFWMGYPGQPSVRQKEVKVEPGHTYRVDLRRTEPTVTEDPR